MIKKLLPNEVFIFGSNLAGNHAGGAARQALLEFGAKEGYGEGLWGHTYAFPTLDTNLERRSIPELEASRDHLYACATNNPHLTFLLTKVGCGIAGFSEEEIAPLFKDAPKNIKKPDLW